MYLHQYTKGEPNWFTGGAVIGTNAHIHSPHTQTNLCISYMYIHLYIYLDLYIRGKQKIYEITDIPLSAF